MPSLLMRLITEDVSFVNIGHELNCFLISSYIKMYYFI